MIDPPVAIKLAFTAVLPKSKSANKSIRKKGKTAIITDSPYKAKLESEMKLKDEQNHSRTVSRYT